MNHDPHTIVVYWSGLPIVVLAAFAVWRRQSRGRATGGSLSVPKAVWLGLAVFLWFVASPALALESGLENGPRLVLGVFSAGMWLRGMVELWLLGSRAHWKPGWGIAHDVLSLVWLACGWVFLVGAGEPSDPWHLAFFAVLGLSLVLEIVYAAWFSTLVGDHTSGSDAIWFASATDRRFETVNRLTAAFDAPLVVFVAALGLRIAGVL